VDDHARSFKESQKHSGFMPAVLVITEVSDQQYVASNGVYISPGRVITHFHEPREKSKIWVISPYAGCSSVPYKAQLTLDTDGCYMFDKINVDLDTLLKKKEACREVFFISFSHHEEIPREQKTEISEISISEVTDLDKVIEGLKIEDINDLPFVKDYKSYLEVAVERPISNKKSGVKFRGEDYCILSIEPFEGHPEAKFLVDTQDAKKITILGHSLYTHLCDGTDSVFNNSIRSIVRSFIEQRKFGARSINLDFEIQMTCFSQIVRTIGTRLVSEVTHGGIVGYLPNFVCDDEIWDPARSNPENEALIVSGLSGSGLYDEKGNLVGLVSCAHKSNLPEVLQKIFVEALKRKDREAINRIKDYMPSSLNYPLLNIHQKITSQIYHCLEGSSCTKAASG